jgi:serine/threonine protein kinase
MTPERWHQIDKLLQAVLEREPTQRSAFLDEACAGDEGLRNEVESLLRLQEQARNFMETPVFEIPPDLLGELPAESDLERNQIVRSATISEQEDIFSVEKGPAIVYGKYLLECRLGHGGMGFVYRARHLELRKPFALKLVEPHKSHRPEYLARFRIEAQALGRLNHPNIIQVTDFGIDSRAGPYLVMEYIEGITLSAYIKHKGPLSLDEALPMFRSIACALDYAHDCGILHRDLKPANVLLFQGESGHRNIKILDFGIARFLDSPDMFEVFSESKTTAELPRPQRVRVPAFLQNQASRRLTDAGTIVGTPEYIAPEVLRGENATASVDIYAFGILIYEILVGRCPFRGSVSELLSSHLHREPSAPSIVRSSVPKELDRAILSPLNKDPASRPSRARDVVTELCKASHKAQVRQWRRNELPRRAVVSVVIAVLMLMLYPVMEKLPAVQTLENKLVDARVRLQPLRTPDPRIVLVSIDEATLSSDPRPLVEKADEVGALLEQAFKVGARAVVIDLLLPEQWSNSESFSRLILDHSRNMVLASYSSPEGGVKGPECVKGLVTVALGRERVEKLFGFVNLQEDPDGVVRTMPLTFRDQRGKSAYSFAARAGEVFMARNPIDGLSGTRLWVDYSIDWTKFRRISWKDAPYVLAKEPEAFRDRMILVGGEFAGSGDVYRAISHFSTLPGEVSGLVLQALTLNTLLEGRQIKNIDETLLAASLCIAIAVAVMMLLSLPGIGWVIVMWAMSGVLYILVSFLFFRWNQWLWPIIVPAVAFCLAIVCAILLRRKLPSFPKIATEEKGI